MFKKRNVTDLLEEMREIMFALDQVNTDAVDSTPARWLNKAKNRLSELIADGERRLDQMKQSRYYKTEEDSDKTGRCWYR